VYPNCTTGTGKPSGSNRAGKLRIEELEDLGVKAKTRAGTVSVRPRIRTENPAYFFTGDKHGKMGENQPLEMNPLEK
jgi:hypothetical protein